MSEDSATAEPATPSARGFLDRLLPAAASLTSQATEGCIMTGGFYY